LQVDERHYFSVRRGNGCLRRQIWVNRDGRIARYRLAYINHRICQQDNGRVLGYDNAHGYHHRHYFGSVEPVDFTSFESIEQRFEQEFQLLHQRAKDHEQ
jgi:hypothetical protein